MASFFEDTARRFEALEPAEREALAERLRLARALLGSTDPLDWFRAWRTPQERPEPDKFVQTVAGNVGVASAWSARYASGSHRRVLEPR